MITTQKLKEALLYIFCNSNYPKLSKILLQPTNWTVLLELILIFKIFRQPTIRLQNKYYINLNKGFLYIYSIYRKLNKFLERYKNIKYSYCNGKAQAEAKLQKWT